MCLNRSIVSSGVCNVSRQVRSFDASLNDALALVCVYATSHCSVYENRKALPFVGTCGQPFGRKRPNFPVIGTDCSLFTSKPAHSSPYLPRSNGPGKLVVNRPKVRTNQLR